MDILKAYISAPTIGEDFHKLLSLTNEVYFLQRRARVEDVLAKWEGYTKMRLSADEKNELIMRTTLTPGAQIGAVMGNRIGLVGLLKEYFLLGLQMNAKRNQTILKKEADNAWKLFVESQKKILVIK